MLKPLSGRLDFASCRCCLAKLQLAMTAPPSAPGSGDVLYTDLLVLLRLQGRWQIISKVFDQVPLRQQTYVAPWRGLVMDGWMDGCLRTYAS